MSKERLKIFPNIVLDGKLIHPLIGVDSAGNQFNVETEGETHFQVISNRDGIVVKRVALGEAFPISDEAREELAEFLPGGRFSNRLRILTEKDVLGEESECQKN